MYVEVPDNLFIFLVGGFFYKKYRCTHLFRNPGYATVCTSSQVLWFLSRAETLRWRSNSKENINSATIERHLASWKHVEIAYFITFHLHFLLRDLIRRSREPQCHSRPLEYRRDFQPQLGLFVERQIHEFHEIKML